MSRKKLTSQNILYSWMICCITENMSEFVKSSINDIDKGIDNGTFPFTWEYSRFHESDEVANLENDLNSITSILANNRLELQKFDLVFHIDHIKQSCLFTETCMYKFVVEISKLETVPLGTLDTLGTLRDKNTILHGRKQRCECCIIL